MTIETPETGGGVVAQQQAVAEARDRGAEAAPAVTPSTDRGTLAVEALKIAAYHNDTPESVTDRASTYLDWIEDHVE